MTTSTLTYVPSFDDQDKTLSCRVEHALLSAPLQQGWQLKIKCMTLTDLKIYFRAFFNLFSLFSPTSS